MKILSPNNPEYDAEKVVRAKKNPGYVYIMKVKGHNVCKIGCSTDVERRRKTLQAKHGFELEVIAKYYDSDNYTSLEVYCHCKYSKYKLSGEWFLLPDDEIERIASSGVQNG